MNNFEIVENTVIYVRSPRDEKFPEFRLISMQYYVDSYMIKN